MDLPDLAIIVPHCWKDNRRHSAEEKQAINRKPLSMGHNYGKPWKNGKSRGTPLSPAKSASGLSESTPARRPCVSSEVPSLLDPTWRVIAGQRYELTYLVYV